MFPLYVECYSLQVLLIHAVDSDRVIVINLERTETKIYI